MGVSKLCGSDWLRVDCRLVMTPALNKLLYCSPSAATHWTSNRRLYLPFQSLLERMNTDRLARSPSLMSRGDTGLLVVDLQERLLPSIAEHELVVWNTRRLIDGAATLQIPIGATEQYPRGLGPTVAEIAAKLGEIPDKLTFSCGGCPAVFTGFQEQGIHKLLVVGIETHVCVQQTVFDLMSEGFQIYLAVDALGSRNQLDKEIALRRMDSAGATLTTTESALFEWCDVAGTPEFKTISALVRETPPGV